eukprot:6208715-Pleurochrysis_carterae.AAC.1
MQALSGANKYLQIRLLGVPAFICGTVLQAACLGAKDATSPLLALAFGGILNLVLDLLLVFKFNQGIAGAAPLRRVSCLLKPPSPLKFAHAIALVAKLHRLFYRCLELLYAPVSALCAGHASTVPIQSVLSCACGFTANGGARLCAFAFANACTTVKACKWPRVSIQAWLQMRVRTSGCRMRISAHASVRVRACECARVSARV